MGRREEVVPVVASLDHAVDQEDGRLDQAAPAGAGWGPYQPNAAHGGSRKIRLIHMILMEDPIVRPPPSRDVTMTPI